MPTAHDVARQRLQGQLQKAIERLERFEDYYERTVGKTAPGDKGMTFDRYEALLEAFAKTENADAVVRIEEVAKRFRERAERLADGIDVRKDGIGVTETNLQGTDFAGSRPQDRRTDGFNVRLHERETQSYPERHLVCSQCGTEFRVSEGVAAHEAKQRLREQRRRLEVGLEPEDRDQAVKDALKAGARKHGGYGV